MGAGASAHAETSESGGQQITKYGRYAVTMDNDKPIRVSRPDAVRRRTGRSDLTVYRSGAFTVEVNPSRTEVSHIVDVQVPYPAGAFLEHVTNKVFSTHDTLGPRP